MQENADWSLFCPNEAPGLADCWGEEFEVLYRQYESEGRARKTIKAQQLWFAILEAQVSGACVVLAEARVLFKRSAAAVGRHLGALHVLTPCA